MTETSILGGFTIHLTPTFTRRRHPPRRLGPLPATVLDEAVERVRERSLDGEVLAGTVPAFPGVVAVVEQRLPALPERPGQLPATVAHHRLRRRATAGGEHLSLRHAPAH